MTYARRTDTGSQDPFYAVLPDIVLDPITL